MRRGQFRVFTITPSARVPSIAISRHPRRLLDLLEQVAVAALYVWLIFRLWPNEFSAANWYPLLIVLSEGLVVVLIVLRRPTRQISTRGGDWALAVGGTLLALLVDKGGAPIFGALGVLLMLSGMAIHVGAKLSLLRSFGIVPANRGVKAGGLYRVVRHPMYAGYMLSHVGFLFVAPSLWNAAVYAAAWALLVARIYAEERVLNEDAQYRELASRVRYRLVPGVF